MKKIISIIGARPQFIKHAPMQLVLQKYFNAVTIHTGQHYDKNMSNVFFEELGINEPEYMLNIKASSQGEQTGRMMMEIEKVCLNLKPDYVLVYGDTNSTLAAALVAAKLQIPIIHIESGLRSFNREMPEEINRIVTDQFSDLLFCPNNEAVLNLKKEGIDHDRIFICGDVMCDTLRLIKDSVRRLNANPYYFATIHRPYNTDDEQRLIYVLEMLNKLDNIVIFPIHPRTIARLKSFNFAIDKLTNIQFIEPVGYTDSISYQKFANCVITDSGGVQKEAYMLKKKCITIRKETEWTDTLKGDWNILVFDDLERLPLLVNRPTGEYVEGLFGDGYSAEQIIDIIRNN